MREYILVKQGGGVTVPTIPTWTDPVDWFDLSGVSDSEALFTVTEGTGIGFKCTVYLSGTYSIEWGDGTVSNNIVSGVLCEHLYSTGGTLTSEGLKIWKLRIYNPSTKFLSIKVATTTFSGRTQTCPILSANIGIKTLEDCSYMFYGVDGAIAKCVLLKSVKIASFENCWSAAGMFAYCSSLEQVSLPVSWGNFMTDASSFFIGCTSLKTVTLPLNWGSTLQNLGAFFSTCNRLVTVSLPSTWGSGVRLVHNFFYNCTCLIKITIPDSWESINAVQYMFYGCIALTDIVIPNTWPVALTNVSGMFQNCNSLIRLQIPISWRSITNASAFIQSCNLLTKIELPATWGNVTNISNFFNTCIALTSVTLPSSWGSITNVSNLFSYCYSLREITLPTSWGSVTSVAAMFAYCYSLKTISVPTTWNPAISSLSAFFQDCRSLQKFTFPQSPGSITNTLNMFNNCYSLTEVTLPTSRWNLTSMSGMFGYCYSLIKINNIALLGSITNSVNLYLLSECQAYAENVVIDALLAKLELKCFSSPNMKVTSLRLTNNSSQFAGASPQIDIQYLSLDAVALNTLFGDLPTVSGKTINITGCTGAATCIRSIATGKGWTVTG